MVGEKQVLDLHPNIFYLNYSFCNIVALGCFCSIKKVVMKWWYLMVGLVITFVLMPSCAVDLPPPPPIENEEEIITDVVLTFSALSGEMTVTAAAQDPDGQGPEDLQILDIINLSVNTSYELAIELQNAVAGESITEEVKMEADEHLFFFEWNNDIFSRPEGNGNVDNRNDPVQYNDQDSEGLPLGLSTIWTTAQIPIESNFRIVLKHQPGQKSSFSDVNTGDTDVDLTWIVNID